jgi:nucleoside-diphosphate-sugar epimerase
MSEMISVYGGTGFIGGIFCQIYSEETIIIPREERKPQSNNILYFLSTTSNYNVFQDLHVDIDTNLNILMEVLEHCKDNDVTFNYMSTGFVYGNDIINAKETDHCDPRGFYSITKRSAEQLLVSYCETFGIKYRILRGTNTYGHDKTKSCKKNVLGHMVNLLKNNEEVILYDNGKFYKDYMHVEDVCRAIKMVLEEGEVNTIYNIGTGHTRLYREIIYMARDLVSSESKIIPVDTPDFYKKVQAKNFTLNVDKLYSLGFRHKISIEEGLRCLCFDVPSAII